MTHPRSLSLVISAILLLNACHDRSPPSLAITPEAVVHLRPTTQGRTCGGEDQALLQSALDQAPVHIVLDAGTYCLDAPLTVHSHTRIEGMGDGRNGVTTRLVQTRPATAVFHLKGVEDVTISAMEIALPAKISQAHPDDDCIRNPTARTLCMWQRATAISAYDSRHIHISKTTLVGGRAGIALLDQSNLESPSGGPQAQVSAIGNGWRIEDDTCSGGGTPVNRAWIIEDNRIEGAQDGLLIYNLSDSLIRRNTIRRSVKFNGIKIGCGPVVDNQIIANYLHGNGQGGVGDGIDVAWGWTIEEDFVDGELVQIYEDPPDGPFRGNLIEGNLAWNNLGNGLAIKVKKGEAGCQGYLNEPLYQLGSNTLRRNGAWNNGLGGSVKGEPPQATTSQLELRCIRPRGTARMEISGNVFAGRLPPLAALGGTGQAPFPITILHPRHGATLDRLHQADYHDNWHRGLFEATTPQPAAWDINLTDALLSPTSDNHLVALYARPEAVSTPLPDIVPPTDEALVALLAGVAQSDGYHCRDDDADACPNLCEALSGRDHLRKDQDKGGCDCTALCPAPP